MDIDFRLILESIVAGILLILSWYGKSHAKKAAQQASSANDAVNHRHKTQPRLFDVVLKNNAAAQELLEWKRSYDDSPWNTGKGVKDWLEENRQEICNLKKHCHLHEKNQSCKEETSDG